MSTERNPFESLGVSPQKAKQFLKKGIRNPKELVQFLPRKYNDFTYETGILAPDQVSCITVQVADCRVNYGRVETIMAKGTVAKTGEAITIVWFHQTYLKPTIQMAVGRMAYVAGKITYDEQYKHYNLASPVMFEPNIEEGKKIYPVYSKIAGMSNEYLVGKIRLACDDLRNMQETLPYRTLGELGLDSMQEALYRLHFPSSMQQIQRAQRRILFEDLIYFAMHNEWRARNSAIGSPYGIKTRKLMDEILESLPYSLTEDQKKAVDGMISEIRQGKRINALVQGDVGCGKTIVAFLLMALLADSGYQAALMAPTQVLAKQHYLDLKALVEPLGYQVAYLSTELRASEKKKAKDLIASGKAQFIVGTNSVVAKDVTYKNLALVVADEEHKFGVSQRESLVKKASEGVHSITMSATPIPRTLATVLYGNSVQLHTIHSMPKGRKAVRTGIQTNQKKIFDFIITHQKPLNYQTYVVCPMIDQNEEMQGVQSVREVANAYRKALERKGITVATLTGRDKKSETEETLTAFKEGKIDVLISTTVVEVGINVPNATAIIITNAERFGLASLHQLRGRVGRGTGQSYCVLVSDPQTEEGRQRLDAMCSTNSGFEIAQADLRIRGAGDFIGTKQSGNDNKYMAPMLAYPKEYEQAQEAARDILDHGTPCAMLERVMREQKEMEFA